MKSMHLVGVFSPEQWRQRAPMLAVGLLVLVVTVWFCAPEARELQALDGEVTQLQNRLQSEHGQGSLPASAPQDPRAIPDLPDLSEAETIWPWLQQRLQAQGLQLKALQPQATETVQGLPEQAVRLRLQGRWRDWLLFEQAIDAHAPWWTMDHWQIAPDGTKPGEVRIELQVRWGLLPPALQTQRGVPRTWPAWTVAADPASEDALLFNRPSASPVALPGQAAVHSGVGALPADPRSWPVSALRLLGVWQQGGAAHAVLGLGLDKVTVKPGQLVGVEGYRVGRVHDTGIELQPPRTHEPVLRLNLQAERP